MAKVKKKKAGTMKKKTKKKAASKPATANSIEPQKPLTGMEDEFEIPEDVFTARKELELAEAAAKKHNKRKRVAKLELTEALKRHDMKSVPRTDGEEDFVIKEETKISSKKRPKPPKKKDKNKDEKSEATAGT